MDGDLYNRRHTSLGARALLSRTTSMSTDSTYSMSMQKTISLQVSFGGDISLTTTGPSDLRDVGADSSFLFRFIITSCARQWLGVGCRGD